MRMPLYLSLGTRSTPESLSSPCYFLYYGIVATHVEKRNTVQDPRDNGTKFAGAQCELRGLGWGRLIDRIFYKLVSLNPPAPLNEDEYGRAWRVRLGVYGFESVAYTQ